MEIMGIRPIKVDMKTSVGVGIRFFQTCAQVIL
jgi:hypothetical protein